MCILAEPAADTCIDARSRDTSWQARAGASTQGEETVTTRASALHAGTRQALLFAYFLCILAVNAVSDVAVSLFVGDVWKPV